MATLKYKDSQGNYQPVIGYNVTYENEVVQTTGTSTTAVMSLKSVTDVITENEEVVSTALNELNDRDVILYNKVTNHIENTDIHVTAAEKEYWNSKVNPPSYSAPTVKQLTYTGEAQELINPGSSTAGSILYSTDETNWSTTIPQATNAGTYTVYWKFAGSEIVYVDSTAISVTIAKADRTVTISGNQTSMTSGLSNTITVTATGNPSSSLISVASSNTAVATISGTTVNAVGGGTTTITATVASDTNYNSGSASYSLSVAWPDGVYAVTTTGGLVQYADINTSSPSSYVGVAIKDTSKNMSFFIDKRFPTGSAAAANVGNFKAWSAALCNKDQSYLTNIRTGAGDWKSISTAAPAETRTAAFNAYNNGETGVVNTTNLVNDSDVSSENASNNAAKYCRSIANPVTGSYDGYLASLAEWIVVNDNQVAVNQILNAIGGVAFATTNSGYNSSGDTYTYYWTSSEYSSSAAWVWYWDSSRSFARFFNGYKRGASQTYCARPFFPLA